MFDFLKKKIKDSISSIQKKIISEEKRQAETNTGIEKEIHEENTSEPHREEERKHRIISRKVTEKEIDEVYSDIKEALTENNVAVSVLDAIHDDLKSYLIGKEVSIFNNKKEVVEAIHKSIADVLKEYPEEEFLSKIRSKKPFIILFIGVNGAGKTTTLAKLADKLSNEGLKIVASASDTFRAASIEQLDIHMKKLKIDLIKRSYGADPAAVAFDAIKHAKATGADVVLIDTAGRSDVNKNLLEELKKVKKVSKPDMTIFVGDALTGNDVVKQAQAFDREVGIDATILSKADVDKKGGAVLSISYVTKKPILFLGTGQEYGDLINFDKEKTLEYILG